MHEIMDELIIYKKERDWKKFHTPENLVKSISIMFTLQKLENRQNHKSEHGEIQWYT